MMGIAWRRVAPLSVLLPALFACDSPDTRLLRSRSRRPYLATDSMGAAPTAVRTIPLAARPELVENSAATVSRRQPGVLFTINDSGNDPLLFAVDTTGADRGVWRVRGANNVDWEAASVGPCAPGAASDSSRVPSADACVYIGDVGDNSARHPTRTIYQLPEPAAREAGFTGSVSARALTYRYADAPHDVEAMYVAPDTAIYLITKRRLVERGTSRERPALVFRIPPEAWTGTAASVAALVDSLPIVPASAPMRLITDAALSPDGRFLAVRTYAELYIFATDSTTGRVRHEFPPSRCNIISVDRWLGEGVAWAGPPGRLVLTSEGRDAPLIALDCPLPDVGP